MAYDDNYQQYNRGGAPIYRAQRTQENFGIRQQPFVSFRKELPLDTLERSATRMSQRYDKNVAHMDEVDAIIANLNFNPEDEWIKTQRAGAIKGRLDDISQVTDLENVQGRVRAVAKDLYHDEAIKAAQTNYALGQKYDELARTAEMEGRTVWKTGAPRQTSYNEETGQINEFKNPYEEGLDWQEQQKKVWDTFLKEETHPSDLSDATQDGYLENSVSKEITATMVEDKIEYAMSAYKQTEEYQQQVRVIESGQIPNPDGLSTDELIKQNLLNEGYGRMTSNELKTFRVDQVDFMRQRAAAAQEAAYIPKYSTKGTSAAGAESNGSGYSSSDDMRTAYRSTENATGTLLWEEKDAFYVRDKGDQAAMKGIETIMVDEGLNHAQALDEYKKRNTSTEAKTRQEYHRDYTYDRIEEANPALLLDAQNAVADVHTALGNVQGVDLEKYWSITAIEDLTPEELDSKIRSIEQMLTIETHPRDMMGTQMGSDVYNMIGADERELLTKTLHASKTALEAVRDQHDALTDEYFANKDADFGGKMVYLDISSRTEDNKTAFDNHAKNINETFQNSFKLSENWMTVEESVEHGDSPGTNFSELETLMEDKHKFKVTGWMHAENIDGSSELPLKVEIADEYGNSFVVHIKNEEARQALAASIKDPAIIEAVRTENYHITPGQTTFMHGDKEVNIENGLTYEGPNSEFTAFHFTTPEGTNRTYQEYLYTDRGTTTPEKMRIATEHMVIMGIITAQEYANVKGDDAAKTKLVRSKLNQPISITSKTDFLNFQQ